MCRNVDFVFMMLLGLPFYSPIITRKIFSLKNLVYISVSTLVTLQQFFLNVLNHIAHGLYKT